jgi:hypothetical protein
MKECGKCNLCCRIMGVRELDKPRNIWCQHVVKGKGCSIHPDRPATCREFECIWLQNQDLPDEFRPDRIHAFLTSTAEEGGVVVHADPGYPAAHLDEPLAGLLKRLRGRGIKVIVICGKRAHYWHQGVWVPGTVTVAEETTRVAFKE